MSLNHDLELQPIAKGISSSGQHFSNGKIKWFSFASFLVLLLVVAITLMQGAFSNPQGAHAAQSKKGVSSPKHAHSSSIAGKSKPVLIASPLSLNFSASAGSLVPPSQTVTIKDGGTRALYWHAPISPATATWVTNSALKTQSLGIRTSSDAPGQLKVYVNATGLAVGSYTAQITLAGTDQQSQPAGGSPQTITVTLKVS